jgi:hypothetical protein
LAYCGKAIRSRSKYSSVTRRCFLERGHGGSCQEFPYLAHLADVAPKVADKIIRDSIMTTGASWKSEDAGPNRILRWVMLLSDEQLLGLGINMAKLKPQVVAKLREKAADYDACMAVAAKLTALVYGMRNAPEPPEPIRRYLEAVLGAIEPGSTVCLVCREQLDFRLFAEARRGKAEIESSHSNPRLHTPDNVGFAHRACNIAQGPKTLDEFYDWVEQILRRARPGAFR